MPSPGLGRIGPESAHEGVPAQVPSLTGQRQTGEEGGAPGLDQHGPHFDPVVLTELQAPEQAKADHEEKAGEETMRSSGG